MNDRACGIEWLTAPLLLFTRSDRALFLFNFVPFLLLPGLIFSMFQRLGVNRRVAWQWMWLLPTGYSFLLQAASSANDTFPTVYALAAVDFAARAWRTRRFSDVGYSLLAAALLTGAKASNMPLLLGWGILLAGLLVVRREIVLHRSWAAIAAVLLAGLVSFLPTAALNVKYCHDWSGLSLERSGMDMKSPLVGIWGNSLIFLLDNFIPPFFPQAGWWNRSALTMLPQAIVRPMVANFEEGFHQLWEMPTEDWVGLGFGPSVLILLSILAGFRARRAGIASCLSPWAAEIPTGLRRCALLAPWLALLVYCMKSGMVTGARLISPYYPLLLPTLLLGAGQGEVVRRAWWKVCTWGALLIAAAVVVLNPARPLWPAKTVLAKISARRPESKLIARAYNAYSIYSVRADPLAAVRALLPQDLAVVGFMAAPDDPDISLWRPFGKRRVEHFLITDTAAAIQARHIDYAVVGGLNLSLNSTPLEAWLTRARAELVAKTSVTVKLAEGPQDWYVVRFRP
jgi:hypothetical protein